jgi:hypothetical protein
MTTAMFGTVVRLGAMKISVAWEDGEERSVSKDIQLAYCMTVHKFQEVRLLMFALSLSTFLRWPAFLTVADLRGPRARDASVSSPLPHLPGRQPGRKAKTDQSQLQENLEGKGRCTMYKYGSNYEVL